MTLLGVVLVLAAFGLLAAEAHAPTHGVLGGAGILGLAGGTWVLVSAAGGGVVVGLAAALVLVAAGTTALAFTAREVRSAGRRSLASGTARLHGTTGKVRAWSERTGQVAADGTLWRARLAYPHDEDPPPQVGADVVIERVENLTLLVRTAEPWELP